MYGKIDLHNLGCSLNISLTTGLAYGNIFGVCAIGNRNYTLPYCWFVVGKDLYLYAAEGLVFVLSRSNPQPLVVGVVTPLNALDCIGRDGNLDRSALGSHFVERLEYVEGAHVGSELGYVKHCAFLAHRKGVCGGASIACVGCGSYCECCITLAIGGREGAPFCTTCDTPTMGGCYNHLYGASLGRECQLRMVE